ncbi:MAG: oligosaccharide flippase family protein, partial [Desulfobacula sp.]|nr:oligosaccharide flippase family protein [Desulfobacula sp.]
MKDPAFNTSKAENYFATEHLKSNLRNLAVRGAGAVISSRLITYFIQMIGTVMLARLLTPRDFGLVGMVTVFSAILVEFGILRLADATIQKEEINHNQISTLLWLNMVLCVVIALIIIGLSPLIVGFYKEPKLKLIIFVIA